MNINTSLTMRHLVTIEKSERKKTRKEGVKEERKKERIK